MDQVVRAHIEASGLPIYSISQTPMDFGENYVYPATGRSHSILFGQIMMGLEKCPADHVFFCEHDVLYHPSHFDFTPPTDDKPYYNNNALRYRLSDRRIVGFDSAWLSQLCANRELLIRHYQDRMKYIEDGNKGYGFEPGSGQSKRIDGLTSEYWESEYPNIDIRHEECVTGTSRMYPHEFKNKKTCQNFKVHDINNIPGWDSEVLLSL